MNNEQHYKVISTEAIHRMGSDPELRGIVMQAFAQELLISGSVTWPYTGSSGLTKPERLTLSAIAKAQGAEESSSGESWVEKLGLQPFISKPHLHGESIDPAMLPALSGLYSYIKYNWEKKWEFYSNDATKIHQEGKSAHNTILRKLDPNSKDDAIELIGLLLFGATGFNEFKLFYTLNPIPDGADKGQEEALDCIDKCFTTVLNCLPPPPPVRSMRNYIKWPSNTATVIDAPEKVNEAILNGTITYEKMMATSRELNCLLRDLLIYENALARELLEQTDKISQDNLKDTISKKRRELRHWLENKELMIHPTAEFFYLDTPTRQIVLEQCLCLGLDDIVQDILALKPFITEDLGTKSHYNSKWRTGAINGCSLETMDQLAQAGFVFVDGSIHDKLALRAAIAASSPDKLQRLFEWGACREISLFQTMHEKVSEKKYNQKHYDKVNAEIMRVVLRNGGAMISFNESNRQLSVIDVYGNLENALETGRPGSIIYNAMKAHYDECMKTVNKFMEDPAKQAPTLTREDVISAYTVGRLPDILKPEHWVGHEDRLRELFVDHTEELELPQHVKQIYRGDWRPPLTAISVQRAERGLLQRWSSALSHAT